MAHTIFVPLAHLSLFPQLCLADVGLCSEHSLCGFCIHQQVWFEYRERGQDNYHDCWLCVYGKLIHIKKKKKERESNNTNSKTARLHWFVGGQSHYVNVKTLLAPFPSDTPVFTSAIPLVSHSSHRELADCQMLTGFIALSPHNFKLKSWVRKLKTHLYKAKIQSKLDC